MKRSRRIPASLTRPRSTPSASPGYAAQAHEERLEALAEYVLVDIQE
jgi:hypothetical protein